MVGRIELEREFDSTAVRHRIGGLAGYRLRRAVARLRRLLSRRCGAFLRKKLAGAGVTITTVRGLGYMLAS